MARSKSSSGHPWLKRLLVALIAAVAASVLARRKALAPAPQFDLQLSTRPEPPANRSDPPASSATGLTSASAPPSAEETPDEASEIATDATDELVAEELAELEDFESEPDLAVTESETSGALNSGDGYLRMTSGERACPEDFPIKGNASSHIYHLPGESSYEATIPEICFSDEDVARSMGYRPRKH